MIDLAQTDIPPSEYSEFKELCNNLYRFVANEEHANLFRLMGEFPEKTYPRFNNALNILLNNSCLVNGSKGFRIGNPPDFKEEENEFPTIFRVDRIEEMEHTGKTFHIPYADRFKDGEFRRRVQFMYPGPLRRVTFTYSGPSVEAVLDRLPTAKVLEEKEGIYTITAEAFGIGIDMWLGSQGDRVKVIQ